jgi:hypothetical protein
MPAADGGSDAEDAASFDADTFDVDIIYADRVLPDVAPAHGDAGVSTDAADAGVEAGLQPCTTAGQSGCVSCVYSGDAGVCSPTEALVVQRDIDLGNVTAPGPDPVPGTATCYDCLANSSCIDSPILGTSGKECEDPLTPVNGMTTTSDQCRAVLACIFQSGIGNAGCALTVGNVNHCYCGTDPAQNCVSGSASAPVPMGVNGACAQQMVAGLGGFPLGDGTDIIHNITNRSLATGRADQILVCAAASSCNCF